MCFEILHGAWWENLKEMGHLEDLGIDGTKLQLILNKYGGRIWIGFIWLWIGKVAGSRCTW
jgi:hypothetical protein